jgi:hypothetical protein
VFLLELLNEILRQRSAGEISEITNFVNGLLTSRRKEEKDKRKKGKPTIKIVKGGVSKPT